MVAKRPSVIGSKFCLECFFGDSNDTAQTLEPSAHNSGSGMLMLALMGADPSWSLQRLIALLLSQILNTHSKTFSLLYDTKTLRTSHKYLVFMTYSYE